MFLYHSLDITVQLEIVPQMSVLEIELLKGENIYDQDKIGL